MSRNNGLAAFIAGFGASYLDGRRYKDRKEERERAEKRDEERERRAEERYQKQQERLDKQDAQDDAVSEGLQASMELRPGQTMTEADGTKYNTDATSFQQRLMSADPSIDPAAAAKAAEIYSQRSQDPAAAEWLDKGFDGTRVKPTTEADIARAQGAAFAKGGSRYAAQAVGAQEKAQTLDVKQLQSDVLKANSIEELSKLYDTIDDGRSVHAEEAEGKYVVYTKDDDTGRTQLVGRYANFNEYRDELAATLAKDPESSLAYLTRKRMLDEQRANRQEDNALQRERFESQDAFREKQFAAQQAHQRIVEGNSAASLALSREKHQVDIAKELAEGNIAIDEKGNVKPGAGGGKMDTTTLNYLNKTTDEVTQEVAAVLDSGGKANFTVGKNKYVKSKIDDLGNEVVSSAQYVVNPLLQKHAYALVSHGVPKADAVKLLADRKKVNGKFVYSNLGKATVAGPDGKPVTRWGFMYKGQLIPLN